MAIVFPTALDDFTNPTPTDGVAAVSHALQHSNHNDAIEALEAKVGINGSADTDSLDYKINNTLVPYTGASSDVDLGARGITAASVATSGGDVQTQLNAKQPTLPNFTTGQILFGDGDNVPSTDSNLFWDNSAKKLNVKTLDANTASTAYPVTIGHNCSSTPVGGFATAIKFQGQTTTTANQDMAAIEAYYNVATHASRAVFLRFFIYDSSGNQEVMRISSTGTSFFKAPTTSGVGFSSNSSANIAYDSTSTTGRFINGTMTAGVNNTTNVVNRAEIRSGGTPTANFGSRRTTTLQSSTTTGQLAAHEDVIWSDATHATRTSAYVVNLVDNATQVEAFRAQGSKFIAGGVVRLKGYTVATLPAGTIGDMAYVTDALTPVFMANVVGGGAVVTKVFYNGANWIVG